MALGADDPLLFGSRLAGQYAAMRAAHGFSDAQLADLARGVDPRVAGTGPSVPKQLAGRHRRLAGGRARLTRS